MTIQRKPSVIGPTDPDVARSLQSRLTQAAVIANGKPTVSNSELILPRTTVTASAHSVTLNTSANNQPSDTVTVYPSSGNVYVSTIDQTIKQNIVNQTGVYSIIAGNNISITSTGLDGTGNVTINAVGGGSGNTGNIGFTGNAIYCLGGVIVENADLTHGATSSLILPINGNTAPAQLTNTYGNVVVTTGINAGSLKNWTFDNTGNLTLPNNANIAIYGNTTQFNTCPNGFLGLNSYDAGSNNIARIGISSADKLVGIGVSDPITELDYNWAFINGGGTIFPTLSVQRGDNPSGTITGQTLLFGDITQEAIISTPDGNSTYQNSQRLVINPGAGAPTTGGEGGDIYLWAGRGGNASGSGGDIKIRGGQGGANTSGGSGGAGGYIRIEAGDAASAGTPGYATVVGGNSSIAQGGYVEILGGQGATIGGDANLKGGYGFDDRGGNVNIWGGGTGNGQSNEGNVNIQTGGNTWTFDPSGNLTLPAGGIVHETGIPFGGLTGNTIALKPAGGTNADQQLLVYPTAGQDFNHLHLTSGNLWNTELFLGNDDFYVKLANTGNVVINTNDNNSNSAMWTFGTDGLMTLPNGNVIIGSVLGGEAILANNTAFGIVSQGSNGSTVVQWIDDIANSTALSAIYINSPTGNVGDVQVLTGEPGANANVWNFSTTGNLTLPTGGQIIISGGLVASGASPAPTINGFSITNSVDISGNGNIAGNNISATGNVSGANISTTGQIKSTQAGNLSDGGGQLYLNGTGNNRIDFNTNGTGAPTFTTRSAGTKVVLFPNLGASATDYALGIDSATFWSGVPDTSGQFKWYAGTTEVANLSGTGTLTVTGNISGNTNGYTIGYLNIPQVAASNTTLALTDAGKHYYSTSSGNFTLTVPNNTTTSFATGTAISIVVQSAGNVLVNAASGVTLYMAGNSTAANRVVSNYGMATLMKVATDTWFINGTGVA